MHPEKLKKVQSLLSDGENAFNQNQIRKTLDISESAIAEAWGAEQQAYKLRTDATQADADASIILAKESGAGEHSPLLLNQALNARKQSDQLYSEEKFQEALNAAVQGNDLAIQAKLRLINDAEKATQSALAAQAETYDGETIKTALSSLTQAKMLMDSKDYPASNKIAQVALTDAVKAEKLTWKLRSDKLRVENQGKISDLEKNYAPTKAPKSFQECQNLMVAAQAFYGIEKYQSCFEKLVEADTKVEKTNQELGQIGIEAIASLRKGVEEIKSVIKDDASLAKVIPLMDQIPVAQNYLHEGNLRGLFDLQDKYNKEQEACLNSIKKSNLDNMILSLRNELAEMDKNGVTLFVPEEKNKNSQRVGWCCF